MPQHRSQGGPYHIVQMTKKRQNSNCRYYQDGNCIKFDRVCDISDSCAGFKNGYLNREELKLLENKKDRVRFEIKKATEIRTTVYHYRCNDREVTICIADTAYKSYANKKYTFMAYDKSVKEKLNKTKSFIYDGCQYKYFYEEKLIEDIYIEDDIAVLQDFHFLSK